MTNYNITVDLISSFNSPIGQTIFIGDLVSVFLSNSVFIAGFILVFLFTYAGLAVLRGAGENDPEKMSRGKHALTAAIVGFSLIFATYWIIQLIEAITDIQILNPGI